jgi:membrane associated rhomboid family serine protease
MLPEMNGALSGQRGPGAAGHNRTVTEQLPDDSVPHVLGPAAAAGPAQPPLPRWAGLVSIGAVWVVALVLGILIGVFSRPAAYASWLSLALAVCALLGFVAQLATQQKDGFITRLAATFAGSFVVLGIIGGILAAVAGAA